VTGLQILGFVCLAGAVGLVIGAGCALVGLALGEGLHKLLYRGKDRT
jgi:hypothetical protein